MRCTHEFTPLYRVDDMADHMRKLAEIDILLKALWRYLICRRCERIAHLGPFGKHRLLDAHYQAERAAKVKAWRQHFAPQAMNAQEAVK